MPLRDNAAGCREVFRSDEVVGNVPILSIVREFNTFMAGPPSHLSYLPRGYESIGFPVEHISNHCFEISVCAVVFVFHNLGDVEEIVIVT